MDKKGGSNVKLLAMYHSSVGNTRLVAELLHSRLEMTQEVELYAIEEIGDSFPFENYDGYIIGFPTHHAQPSISMIEFIDNMERLQHKKPAYIFTTCGWFSADALRIFARICIDKNIIPVLSQSYRCAATDGVLVAPFIKALFTYEKKLVNKIESDTERIITVFDKKPRINLPHLQLISVLNYPNKKIGEWITLNIFLHEGNCTKCGKCIRNCNGKALTVGKDSYPKFDKSHCEKCYRCIHHCPTKALSLSKRKLPKKQLTREFFDSYKTKIISMIKEKSE